MGTGASKSPLRSTANVGIATAKWKINAQATSSSSSGFNSNLAPDSNSDNSKLTQRPSASDDKDIQDLNAEGRWDDIFFLLLPCGFQLSPNEIETPHPRSLNSTRVMYKHSFFFLIRTLNFTRTLRLR